MALSIYACRLASLDDFMEKLKIGFVSDAVYPWHAGGIEVTERTQAEVLAKIYDVSFLSMKWPGMKRRFTDRGIHYHAFLDTDAEHFYRHRRRSIRTAVLYVISCTRIFRYRFDAIIVNMFPFLHLPILKLYCKITGCKLIIDVAEVWTEDYWAKYLGSEFFGSLAYSFSTYFFRSANYYICNSHHTSRRLVSEGINPDIIGVFSPILNDKELAKIKGQKKKQLIFVGRLIREKRVELFLDVVAKARTLVPGLKALIIGKGPEEGEIRSKIATMGLDGAISMVKGFSDIKKVYMEMANSIAFLQLSSREGLSRVTLESVAVGTPVIAPSDTPLPDEVRTLCQVTSLQAMPALIKRIAKSSNKASFISHADTLSQFYTSRIPDFYKKAFDQMGLMQD